MSTAPKTLGDYELLEELGRGGAGVVFRARHRVLGHEVALKKLLHGASLEELTRFRREAKRLASLQHPGIVAVRQVVLEGAGAPFLVMTLAEGESLEALVRREGPLPGARAASIVARAARAIAAAHGAGIVHRDLKPSNLVVTPTDDVVLLDFGLARRLTHESLPATQSGDVVGTPSFIAPEQLAGEVGPGVDVYGLGACLYLALCARPPFEGDVLAVLSAVANRPPQPPSSYAQVPPWLEALCLRCLAKQPGQRPASAAALADALEAGPAAGASRSGRLIAAVLGVGLLAGGVAATIATRPPPEEEPASRGRPPTALELMMAGRPPPGRWPSSQPTHWTMLDPGRARLLADRAARAGDDGRALTLLGEALEADPWFAEALVQRAQLRPERERAAAIADLDRACALGFVDFLKRGELRLALTQFGAAEADLTIAARLSPHDPRPDYLRAGVLQQQGFTEGAIEALSASIARDPIGAFPLAWIERGRLRARLLRDGLTGEGGAPHRPDPGAVRAAINDLDVGLRRRPHHGRALHNRADLKLMLGDRRGARADLEAALEARPPLSPTVQQKVRAALAKLRE